MAKLEQASGIIQAMTRDGKSFRLEDPDTWYGAYRAAQIQGAQKGDDVEFEYDEVTKGGKTYKNIQGNVTIVEGPAREEPKAARGRAPAREAKGESPDQRQRSIVRQNSLTQANAILHHMAVQGTLGDGSPEEHADLAVELARVFEKYSMVEDE